MSGRLLTPLFVFLASIAFATSGPMARLARPAHPLFVAFGRVAIASVVLLVFSGRTLLPFRMPRAVILGGVLLAAHFALFLWGLETTSLPAAIALVSLEPLSVVLAAWAIHGDRPRRPELVGVIVATVGGAIVAQGAGSGEHRLLGDVLVLVAVALYGVYVAAVRHTRDLMPATTAAALVYLVSAITLGLAVLVTPRTWIWPLPSRALVAIAGLAFIPTLLGHTAVQAASRVMSPSVVALVSPGESMLGIAIAAIFMGARPTATEAAGALVIVAGATIAIVAQKGGTSPPGVPPEPMQGGVTQAQR